MQYLTNSGVGPHQPGAQQGGEAGRQVGGQAGRAALLAQQGDLQDPGTKLATMCCTFFRVDLRVLHDALLEQKIRQV